MLVRADVPHMASSLSQKQEPREARKPRHAKNEARADGRLLPALKCLIVLYAFLAGLRTVADPDLGWQMATGRWIVQHRQIPSVDVLSYTVPGQPWIYPVASQLLLYLVHAIGGYALLSLLGATFCALCVWLLVRRGGLWTVALAAIAPSVIADRTMPRAAMFTTLLFASLLIVLWQHYETGRAPLWSLPVLMFAWANLHLGFIAGLALIAAYVGIEVLEMISPTRRSTALERLRGSWAWLLAACFATLVNPWGWGVYRGLTPFQQSAMKQYEFWTAEWAPLPLNWTAISSALSLHNSDGDIYVLLAAAAGGAIVASWRGRLGAAVLLAAAAWLGLRHVRYDALFAAIVVVVAGAVFTEATAQLAAALPANRNLLACRVVAVLIAAFAVLRVIDLVSGRAYLDLGERLAFGVGLSPQMPAGGARFLAGVNVGGNVFNTYDEGGFLSFAIGNRYPVYVDGRQFPFGPQLIIRADELSKAPPDSPEWQKEIAQYNISAIILPLARYNVLEYFPALDQFCHSELWKPVYIDESSAVFVRRGQKTLALPPVDCATVPLPAVPPTRTDRNAFDSWVNASAVLRSLGRSSEAMAANQKALVMFPTSAYARWNQATMFVQMGNFPAAEEQYRLAAEYDPQSNLVWANLGDLYEHQGKFNEAIVAWEKVSKLDPHPWKTLLPLGYVYLEAHRPEDARAAFQKFAAGLPSDPLSVLPPPIVARFLRGRAAVAGAIGDSVAAQRLEDQAWQVNPGSPEDWRQLAHIYASYGRATDAQRAEQRATTAASLDEKR